jgi:uncharacterized protein YxeA
MEINTKNKLFALLCLAATCILALGSSLYTFKLFLSMGTGIYSYVSGVVGLCFDVGKYVFPAAAILYFNREKMTQSIACILLTIICVMASFFASQSFDLNRNNEILNNAIANSDETKIQQEVFNANKIQVNGINKELNNLRSNKEKLIEKASSGLRGQKNSLPSSYITKKGLIQNQIDKLESSSRANIDAKISNLEKQLNNTSNRLKGVAAEFKGIDKNVKTTEGIGALAAWLCPESNPTEIIGNIVLVKNILIEILGIAFSILFGLFLGRVTNAGSGISLLKDKFKNAKNNLSEKLKPEIVSDTMQDIAAPPPPPKITSKKVLKLKRSNKAIENKIGFKMGDLSPTPSTTIRAKREHVETYLTYIINNLKSNNKSPGKNIIKSETALSDKDVNGVRYLLAENNIIKIDGNNTIVLETNLQKALDKIYRGSQVMT